MNQQSERKLYVFIPESSPLDPASRTRCYAIAERLAKQSRVEVLGLDGDPFNFVSLGLQSLRQSLRILPTLRKLRGRAVMFMQRGQSNVPKVLALVVFRRITGNRLVFDFDDSIFLTEPRATMLMCRASDAVTVANAYLGEYASRYNPRVHEIPTAIDLDVYSPRARPQNKPCVIGWTGSPANLKHLKVLAEPLQRLRRKHEFAFRILTDPRWQDRIPLAEGIPFEVVTWSISNFVSVLSTFDIGVAPLVDDAWTRGKAGYRILEYMAMCVPPVASKVGENGRIIDEGVNGFLVDTAEEWEDRLDRLLTEPELRTKIGGAGRRKVEEHHSMDGAAHEVAEILENLPC